MSYCLGFPYCRTEVDADHLACKKCWQRVPKKIRSEALAAVKRFPNTSIAQKAVDRMEAILHRLLFARKQREDNRRIYTIVG